MTNKVIQKYSTADIIVTFVVGVLIGISLLFPPTQRQTEKTIIKYVVDEEDFNFELSSNGYSGWQMGCNYRFGSNAGWNEEKQEYNKQFFLRCANGITYIRITESKQ